MEGRNGRKHKSTKTSAQSSTLSTKNAPHQPSSSLFKECVFAFPIEPLNLQAVVVTEHRLMTATRKHDGSVSECTHYPRKLTSLWRRKDERGTRPKNTANALPKSVNDWLTRDYFVSEKCLIFVDLLNGDVGVLVRGPESQVITQKLHDECRVFVWFLA